MPPAALGRGRLTQGITWAAAGQERETGTEMPVGTTSPILFSFSLGQLFYTYSQENDKGQSSASAKWKADVPRSL